MKMPWLVLIFALAAAGAHNGSGPGPLTGTMHGDQFAVTVFQANS